MAILAGGCRDSAPDARLTNLEEMGEKHPNEAYDSLVAMRKDDLSKEDRMYYDFLSVKLADKAFIRHRSDSVILSVLDYYSHHGNHDLYTEVLYYGGRVYSDMGDYPTALRFYTDALKRTESDLSARLLKGKIVSQSASLLHSVRLYDEARKYIDMALAIDKKLNDTLNLMYDLDLSGINHLNRKDYDKAEHNFCGALSIAEKIGAANAAIYSVHLAAIKNFKMKPDSAVILLGDIPSRAGNLFHDNDDFRQFIYSYSADIYRCADMPDSAYKYALKLIKIRDAWNLRQGYSILLSDALKDVVPQDSIRNYVNQYRALTEKYMNSNGDRSALIQNSLYNYSVVERDREKALEKKRTLEHWLTVSVVLLLALATVVLYYRYRSNETQLKLHQALENMSKLRELLDQERNARSTAGTAASDGTESVQNLRDRLANELSTLCRSRKNRPPLSPLIAESEAYAALQNYIRTESTIPDSSPLWDGLRKAISKASPDFDERVRLLSGGRPKDLGYRLMLLIKCGVTPTQLCFLVGKTKGTLSYQRRMLGLQWLDREIDPRMIDNLIYSL